MPQLSQLSEVYLSQFLWLAIALGFIFFVIARGMLPKIQATVDAREKRIAGDLEAAQQARLRSGPNRSRLACPDGRRSRRSGPDRPGSEGQEWAGHRGEGQSGRRQDQLKVETAQAEDSRFPRAARVPKSNR